MRFARSGCRRRAVGFGALLLAGSLGGAAAAAEPGTPALDLRQGVWRVRHVRGTPEYLTESGRVEQVAYRLKKLDPKRAKPAADGPGAARRRRATTSCPTRPTRTG